MKDLFFKNGISITDEQLEKFENYRKILLFYNGKFNITTITEKQDVYVKHFLDSVLCKDLFVDNSKVIEIGSGGGFPSIPLKIVRDDLNLTLVESTGKKCIFLKEVIKELNLNNVEVLNGRAEDFGKDKKYREKFDHVTARAVARLNTLCEYCMPFIKVGGSFIALKGNAEEEIKEAQNAVNVLGGKYSLIKEYNLPLEEAKRTLIKIEKIKSTPQLYPRGNGKERKQPL
ncbi:MAG: 16S rRNA (guanine(527)-N(7))-methyltransferase RsmG [Clostridia bacterium]|nr:16S rRNA (guanine(527)-N(7))-methyltransferase RsmG [Clostridia bacterium]